MTFTKAIKSAFQNYATIQGRAARSEYWFFVLFVFLSVAILSIIDDILFPNFMYPPYEHGGPLTAIFYLIILVPSFCIGVRRLHDTDRSGWWLLISLLPLFGGLILLFWYIQKGTSGGNRFGGDPITLKEKIVDFVGGS